MIDVRPQPAREGNPCQGTRHRSLVFVMSLLCTHVLRAATAGDRSDPRLDHLDLRWDECHRRSGEKLSRRGVSVRLLLRLGVVLRDGDVLVDHDQRLLVVSVIPAEVLVVRPRSLEEAALTTLELGNLHVPVEVTDSEILTPADGPPMGMLTKRGVLFTVETRTFQPTAISGVTWNLGDKGLTINSPAKVRSS